MHDPAGRADPLVGRLPHRPRGVIRRDRHHPATAARGTGRRVEAVEDGRDAPAGPRAAGHRPRPTMEPRGVPAHPRGCRITAREASNNTEARRRAAAFPVVKALEAFDVTASSIPPATFDYLASLEWVRAAENVCLIGPEAPGIIPRRPKDPWPGNRQYARRPTQAARSRRGETTTPRLSDVPRFPQVKLRELKPPHTNAPALLLCSKFGQDSPTSMCEYPSS